MLRYLASVLVVAAALGIAGCTSDNRTDPAPATTTSTPNEPTTTISPPNTPSKTSRPTAPPPVTDPVDVRPFHDHPCAALTAAQQKQIGFRQYDPVDPEATNSDSSNCVWLEKPNPGTDGGYGYRLTISVAGDPLAEAYSESNPHGGVDWDMFEPRQIRGLPSVVRSLTTPDHQCSVVVGTGNGQGIEINGTIPAGDPSLCDRFVTAAEWLADAARR